MPSKIPYLGHQSRPSEGRARPPHLSAYVGTSLMADDTRLRIMPAMHYACFAPFWRFGKSRWVSPCPVRRPFLLARASTSMKARASLLIYARASQLERESAPIDSIEPSPEDHIFIATLRFVPPSASSSASLTVSTLRCARRFDFCYRSRAEN